MIIDAFCVPIPVTVSIVALALTQKMDPVRFCCAAYLIVRIALLKIHVFLAKKISRTTYQAVFQRVALFLTAISAIIHQPYARLALLDTFYTMESVFSPLVQTATVSIALPPPFVFSAQPKALPTT